jgi:deoxycytidylate deaminase
MQEEKYLSYLEKIAEAIPAAAHNRKGRVLRTRIAACIVYKNEIVSIGINQLKSHPFQAKFSRHEDSIFLHAETDAIKNSLKHISVDQLSKSSLFVCRIKYAEQKKKKIQMRGLCMPCEGCQRAIATFNIKNVIYTCDDGRHKYL